MIDEENESVRLRIVDEGDGIDPEHPEKLFEAFFTTRAQGSGLGLALVRRIAGEHGGECGIRNRDGGGAEVTVRLPLGRSEGETR